MGFFSPTALLIFIVLISPALSQLEEFISIDCGGRSNYTDPVTGLSWVTDSGFMPSGNSIGNPNGSFVQYRTRRDFPIDKNKYCYNLITKDRKRYIVRATFQYGIENNEAYPKFDLYLDATKWTTVSIFDASRIYVKEMIIRAPSDSVSVCLFNALTGAPFISTLELRPLNLSMYATDFEDEFSLEVVARVNFGALTKDFLRYPDDPYDRMWESDLAKRQNFLVGMAAGTKRISTSKNIETRTQEHPPVKVMQTAVVGTQELLSYRLNLDDFPANARAYAYFAEIQDLGESQTRKFKLKEPNLGEYNNAVVNIVENANGSYTLYEPSYMNVTFDFVFSFTFKKTADSTLGPLLNAIEISRYVKIAPKTDKQDLTVLGDFRLIFPENASIDQGDPCLPTPWTWLNCSSTAPPRITKIFLSGKGVKGMIPSSLRNMDALTELWLDGNLFSGSLPNINSLKNLIILHLENNELGGELPTYLGNLPNLQELYIENNSFSGEIPDGLFKIKFNYNGNPALHEGATQKTRLRWITGVSVSVAAVLLFLLIGGLLLLNKHRRTDVSGGRRSGSSLRVSSKPSTAISGTRLKEEGVSYHITLFEIEEATGNFCKRIGKGSFGPVYYGRMKDGKEIAVKIMADSSSHGSKQFVNEVALLSRIHHRNLVPLIGYCEEGQQCLLVYEYMHNGTLRDHIHDPVKQMELNWLRRLMVAEDAAKGLDYLHTGCNPSIIHRDVKTSNILLDKNMRAKMSDFGLSRQADDEDLTHVSSVARGTVGYLDPEYYGNQQLTEKSDVYSFGVVLLELVSGRKPFSLEDYGADWNIVHWSRSLIRKGDVQSIVDPTLTGTFKIESMWRIAEVAIQCVEQHGSSRPKMQEVIMAIQEATKIEKTTDQDHLKLSPGSSSRAQSSRKTLLTSFLEIESPDLSSVCFAPSAR